MTSRAPRAIAAALLASGFLGCGQSEQRAPTEPAEKAAETVTSAPQTPTTEPTPQSAEYPAEIQKNFMRACQANGGTGSQCTCALDEVQEQFTLDEFLKEDAASQAAGGAPSQRVTDAVAECR